jgi:4-hydroxybenzoate polyprenyltransferase
MKPLLVSLRPHQWTKNLLLFAPLALSKHLFEADPLVRTLVAFLLFCGLSGTVYLVNDVVDVERDRLHPRKRLRPVASGALSTRSAALAAVVLGIGCLASSFALGASFGTAALCYLLLNLAYSFKLKEVVIVDAIALALGFVVRAVAGALVIGVVFSEWLLICTILLALFLTFCKRRHELTSLDASASEHRKSLEEYSPYLLDQMISVVTASCLMAYASYTTAPETIEKYRTDRLPWTIPFVLYGIFRYLYLVHRRELGGSPTDILLTDVPLILDVVLWALAILAIVYTAQGVPMPLGR